MESHFGSPTWQAIDAYGYFPHQTAGSLGDLPKILGQELREHYELPQDLPHGMFTLLIELKDRDGSPAQRSNNPACIPLSDENCFLVVAF
jgi:hypothetical protein